MPSVVANHRVGWWVVEAYLAFHAVFIKASGIGAVILCPLDTWFNNDLVLCCRGKEFSHAETRSRGGEKRSGEMRPWGGVDERRAHRRRVLRALEWIVWIDSLGCVAPFHFHQSPIVGRNLASGAA